MKIAFDSQIFALQNYGGISRYFTQLAKGLLELQQHVEVFSPIYINSHLKSLPSSVINGIKIKRYPPKSSRFFLTCNEVVSRYKISRWKPDVIHETYYSNRSVAPPSCPTVITVYDMIHELYSDEFSKKDSTSEIKKIAIERADHVICISENTKNDLIKFYGTPADKISVVLLGFDKFSDNEIHEDASPLSDKPFLLYVGSRSGYKNFSKFLRSVASSHNLLSDFDIVAFGGPVFSNDELSLIHSLGFAESQVQNIHGNDLVLGRYYSAASAFVYPSLYDGFGIPPLEAMAHNCPVVSSNTSSMPEVIGDAGEYFDPRFISNMRYAIEKVVYSESRAESLKMLGSARLTNFSWLKCAEETLDVYQSMI